MKNIFLLLAILFLFGCVQRPPEAMLSPTPAPTPSLTPLVTLAATPTLEPFRTGDMGGQTWEGEILVKEHAFVPEGRMLKILPGTIVKFVACRDYKGSCNKASLEIQGKLEAVGTPEKPIRFTSDAKTPQNGDWSMIRLFGKTKSRIAYAIIEFGQQGVNLWQSDARLDHNVVRWNNWEGLYAESYSTPTIDYNRIYQNGYNGMALEQFNNANISYNIFEQSGTNGLHVDASKVIAKGNVISKNNANGLSLDDHAEVTAELNTIAENKDAAVGCGEGENKVVLVENKINGRIACEANNTEGKGAPKIDFGWEPPKDFDLGYIPGDRQKDLYAYVYPDDETRKVVKKLGQGKGLTWSVALEGKNVWTITVDGLAYLFDGDTGEELRSFLLTSPQPWGATFLNGKLWVTDFAEKRTYSVDAQTGKELYFFENPDQERGAKGLANDGENLLLMGWTTGMIYRINEQGKLLETIRLSEPLGAGGIAFDGRFFWVPCGDICKYDSRGKFVGKIYAASEGTWDLEWDFERNLLWATQRTNENWDDAKVYALQVLKEIPA